ncbi:MAG: phosphate signaling complex protein PhoU [Chromatiales bacterium]|nr:phosphate signaling complex protein PhoU [Gammaproteobacteria bacterium]MBW6476456.1 phosphate signaling complex protein PhoU [Chromatiales bacterium]
MDKINIGQHISQQFNVELEDIRNRVMAMGGLVEQQLVAATKAMVDGNGELAEQTYNDDYKVNAMEVGIDEECSRILARRQPTASDLRLIVAVIKTITDLERIGDQAKRVARMAQRLASDDAKVGNYVELQHMADHVRHMLRDALDAFARMDVDAALEVAREDLKVDKEYEGLMRQLITFMMEDPRTITRVLDVMWAARALERVGDHARNICEYVIYFVKGKDVRHISLESMEEEVRRER